MNNNRNNANNRRRGRGNRNQGGGGNQGNRIDSRARGNAPQLLDKYKKLAEDAHRNGDRVQAEYYLQFADHYFRVIADNRARQDEQRGGSGDQQQRNWRRDERDIDEFDAGGDEDEGGEDNRGSARDDRGNRDSREDRGNRRDRQRRDDNRGGRNERAPAEVEGAEGEAYEADDNPFMRDTRAPRRARQDDEAGDSRPRRRNTRTRREGDDEGSDGRNGNGESIDASILPPSFSANEAGNDTGDGEGKAAPARAPRARRKRDEDGTLSAVG